MDILTIPELFILISSNLSDEEKISFTCCSRNIYNYKCLVLSLSSY